MSISLINQAKQIASNKFLIQTYTPLDAQGLNSKKGEYKMRLLFAKLHYKVFNIFFSNRPWTSPASILFFDKVLNDKMIGLEYGSGRSTVYFARKLRHLVSIEHYEGWYIKVKEMLKNKNIDNVDYVLLPKENSPYNKKDLDIYLNEHNELESKKIFEKYYNKVNEYPDDYFDFVLIDGRSRVRCGLNAINKLKSGGIFVLDNSERERYLPLHKSLNSWPMVNTTNGFTNTTIWIKPGS